VKEAPRESAGGRARLPALLPNRDRNSHLYALVMLAILFYLPYYIPQRPVASDSYLFGFNNRAAIILLLVFSVGAAIWGKGYNLALLPAGHPKKIAGRTLGICLAIQLAACLAMDLLAGGFGGFWSQLRDRPGVASGAGTSAYVGFEWPFGVLFLYGPLWLSHLFHGGIAQGYNAFWTLSSLAGSLYSSPPSPTRLPPRARLRSFSSCCRLPAVSHRLAHTTP